MLDIFLSYSVLYTCKKVIEKGAKTIWYFIIYI
nr:MAG TPA: hypothetical protein [Caudoviricetes sp.]